jgi:hypothetical protein
LGIGCIALAECLLAHRRQLTGTGLVLAFLLFVGGFGLLGGLMGIFRAELPPIVVGMMLAVVAVMVAHGLMLWWLFVTVYRPSPPIRLA